LAVDTGTVTLNSGESDQQTFPAPAAFTGFAVRYLADGSVAWRRSLTDGMAIFGATSAADGTSFITGRCPAAFDAEGGTAGSVTLDGPAFWISYDPEGNIRWARSQTVNTSAFLYDDASGALFVRGVGSGAQTFAIGDADEQNVDLEAQSTFVARVDPATGAVLWLRRATSALTTQAPYRGMTVLGGELILPMRITAAVTLEPGTANAATITPEVGRVWNGNARYALDGTFLGTVEYASLPGNATQDGLTAGTVIEP
jgi:hypothetical protein